MDLDLDDCMVEPPQKSYSTRPQVDLSEWVGHRVLAFKEGVYHVGVIIHVTQDTCDVTVSLEGEHQPVLYPDVLSFDTKTSIPPITSDVTPASHQVSVESSVLVWRHGEQAQASSKSDYTPSKRPIASDTSETEDVIATTAGVMAIPAMKATSAEFVPGVVKEVSSTPQGQPLFLVKLQSGTQMWTRRSQLRATAAPWEEEWKTNINVNVNECKDVNVNSTACKDVNVNSTDCEEVNVSISECKKVNVRISDCKELNISRMKTDGDNVGQIEQNFVK